MHIVVAMRCVQILFRIFFFFFFFLEIIRTLIYCYIQRQRDMWFYLKKDLRISKTLSVTKKKIVTTVWCWKIFGERKAFHVFKSNWRRCSSANSWTTLYNKPRNALMRELGNLNFGSRISCLRFCWIQHVKDMEFSICESRCSFKFSADLRREHPFPPSLWCSPVISSWHQTLAETFPIK